MPLSIMAIVLCAAILHASWNFMVKRIPDKFISMSAVVLGHIPFSLTAIMISPLPLSAALPYLILSAMLHTGYQFFLLNSYRVGDLSQVYPLARGVAPMLVTGFSLFFLGVGLSAVQLAAIFMIGCGIVSLSCARQIDGLRWVKPVVLALATGCFIAAYSLTDGLGARMAGTAVGYYAWLSLLNAAIFAVLVEKARPGSLKKVALQNLPLTLLGGGLSFAAYASITWAFTRAPIALVTALRETSIIFALLFGTCFLKERLSGAKIIATLLTLFGVILLRISH